MPTIASIRLLRQLDVPAARNGTQGRHLFTDPAQTHSVRGVFARTRGTVIRVTERMERIANRAVRPVVVGRNVA